MKAREIQEYADERDAVLVMVYEQIEKKRRDAWTMIQETIAEIQQEETSWSKLAPRDIFRARKLTRDQIELIWGDHAEQNHPGMFYKPMDLSLIHI